jgi:hypothetical protein
MTQNPKPVNRKLFSQIWRFANKFANARWKPDLPEQLPLLSLAHFSAAQAAIIRGNRYYRAHNLAGRPSRLSSLTRAELRESVTELRENCYQVLEALARSEEIAESAIYNYADNRVETAGIETCDDLVRTICIELVSMARNDDTFEVNLKEGYVAITTDPIILSEPDNADIEENLGQFKLKLTIKAVGDYYDAPVAVPLQPNVSSCDGKHPHPHVQGESENYLICLGEGERAIKTAIRHGRLGDALDITESILQNYTPEESFRTLETWHSTYCTQCRQVMPTDDDFEECCDEDCENGGCPSCMRHCPNCHEPVCSDHYRRCGCCGNRYCPGCIDNVCESPTCESNHCGTCSHQCQDCDKTFCSDCFDTDADRCHNCQDLWLESERARELEELAAEEAVEPEPFPAPARNDGSCPLFAETEDQLTGTSQST